MKSKLPRLPLLLVISFALWMAIQQARLPRQSEQPALAATAAQSVQTAASTPAQPQLVARPEPETVGDQLMTRAAAQLERRDSISARLRYQMFLGGKQMYGLGSYWQKGTGDDLRVRFELQIAGQEANLLQVSNSRFLWVERRLPIGRTVTRLDLRQLRAEAAVSGSRLGDIQPGNASWTSSPPELIAHAGGLPSLLAALSESFSFLPPQTMRLATTSEAGQHTTSIPFFAVVGHWRKDKLEKLIPPGGDASVASKKAFPARLPEEVLILVGQADLFPYRLEYRKQETPIAAIQSGAVIPYQLSGNPMVVLEFTDIAFDVPTESGQFNYAPGDAEWTDRTAAVLERLRLVREQQVAEHSAADAAKSR